MANYTSYAFLKSDIMWTILMIVYCFQSQLRTKKLQTLSTDGICDLLKNLPALRSTNLPKYEESVRKNNICGRVLISCDLVELKEVRLNTGFHG
jgi:hypothetical protein